MNLMQQPNLPDATPPGDPTRARVAQPFPAVRRCVVVMQVKVYDSNYRLNEINCLLQDYNVNNVLLNFLSALDRDL